MADEDFDIDEWLRKEQETVDDMVHEFKVVSAVTIGLNSILLLIMLCIGVYVIKLTKCQNIRICMLVVMINLTLISYIVLDVYWFIVLYAEWDKSRLVVDYFIIVIPNIFFCLTLVINLNSWVLYFIKITLMVAT